MFHVACSSSPIRRHSGCSAVLKQTCLRCRHPAAVRNYCGDTRAKGCFADAGRPQCARRFPRLWFGPGGNFRAGCIGVRIVRRNRFHRLRCAAPVVRVKTESALSIELSIGPRAEDQTCFWAGQELGGRAGIGRVHRSRVSQAGDDKFFVVAAQGHDRAEFVPPTGFYFPHKNLLSCP
jgi:hypothetical protein